MNPLRILPVSVFFLIHGGSMQVATANRIDESDSAVLTSYPDGGEFRCIFSPPGQLMPDINYWLKRPSREYQQRMGVWKILDIRLPDFSGSAADWEKSEQAGTIHSDNHGGKWVVKLVETRSPDNFVVCKGKAVDNSSGRCYYFFPAQDFAGYWVAWSASRAVFAHVKYAL
ncbi:MAG: hypothetical protein AAB262_08745, partial [Elusimicrobiota bacterium]